MNEPFYLTDEQRMVRDLARKIARERVAPNAARYDEAEAYPEDSLRALIAAGLYGIRVPEAHGGTAMGALALARARWTPASPATRTRRPWPSGYTREFPVERYMRDAKVMQIYEGTNQIERVVIAKELLE
jgi:alkylation response protein AidB-like acyl-CoA dehydrogenase